MASFSDKGKIEKIIMDYSNISDFNSFNPLAKEIINTRIKVVYIKRP